MTDLKIIHALLNPRSVALIGASNQPGKIGNQVLRNLMGQGYEGNIFPINPKEAEIGGYKAYAKITDVPEEVDVAALAVPVRVVPDTVAQCAEQGVKGVVIYAGGFAEKDAEGAKLQQQLVDIHQRTGIRIFGPNINGIYNAAAKMNLSFNPLPHAIGPVSMVTQSGAFGTVINLHGQREGIGFGKHIAMGNRCDVHEAELFEYLATDEHTKAVAFFLESIKDEAAFETAAKALTAKKPVVGIKIGRSEAGRDISMTNTASATGDDAAYDALLARCGALRVDTSSEMMCALTALLHQPAFSGNRLGLVTMTGGLAAICVETAERYGFVFPRITDEAQQALGKIVPDFLRQTNPIDLGNASVDMLHTSMNQLFNDPNVDGVILILLVNAYITDETIMNLWDAVKDSPQQLGKPTTWCLMGRTEVPALVEQLRQRGCAAYQSPDDAAFGMYALRHYAQARKLIGGE